MAQTNMQIVARTNTERAYKVLNKLLHLEAYMMGNKPVPKDATSNDSLFHHLRETNLAIDLLDEVANRLIATCGYEHQIKSDFSMYAAEEHSINIPIDIQFPVHDCKEMPQKAPEAPVTPKQAKKSTKR